MDPPDTALKVDLKISQTSADLEKQKKIYNSVNLKLLPDKGDKLKQKINYLENMLNDLTISKKDCLKSSLISSKEKQAQEVKNKSTDMQKKVAINTFACNVKNIVADNVSADSLKSLPVNSRKIDVSSLKSDREKSSEETSRDSGYCDHNTASKSFPVDGMLSFLDLSQSAPQNDSTLSVEDVHSPAFKTWRKNEAIPSIKLTEAKPLFEKNNPKKNYINAYSKNFVYSVADDETVKKLHHNLTIYPDNAVEEEQPKYLNISLMTHQIKALSWLIWRETQIPSGGILADDMGLGKTLTMIALVLKQREKNNFASIGKEDSKTIISKGTLVVCIASIVHQWNDEITKHCRKNALNVLMYHGAKRNKDIEFMRRHDIVLTTYNVLLSERKAIESKGQDSGLFKLKWERVILDEAHTIKNHSSKTAEAVYSLQSFRKWCVTGTPIHNDMKDIYSLIKFLQFYPFDDYKKFKKLIDDNTMSSDSRRNMLVKSILLRRTKTEKDDKGMPLVKMMEKSLLVSYIDLSSDERKVYEDLNKKANDIINKFFLEPKKKFNNSNSLLVLLLRLQQCCCHISLLGKEAEDSVNDSLSDISTSLSSLSITDNSKGDSKSESELDLTFSEYETHHIYDPSVKSTKIQKLFDELDKITKESNNTAKSVIVSQWVSMLELIEYHLKKENKAYHVIVGSTKPEERQRVSEDFNYNSDGCKILLLSLKAGGVGLNLIGASHLFLLDLHWNPALELQACDRIHRVGQKNDVFIHKFVCKDTIEEKILALQSKKSSLASDVLYGAGKIRKGLSMEDFKTLFNVRW